jgi:hypothetical protein
MLPLINRTAQSYGRSLMSVEDIIKHAKENNLPVAALTDLHSMSSLPDFLLRCKQEGIHGIAGMTVNVVDKGKPVGELVLLAKGGAGFAGLRDLLDEIGHVGVESKYTPSQGVLLTDLESGKYANILSNCLVLDGFPGSLGDTELIRKEIRDVASARRFIENKESVVSKIKSQCNDGEYIGVQSPGHKSILSHAMGVPEGEDGSSLERRNVVMSTIGYAKDDEQAAQTMQWFSRYAGETLRTMGEWDKVREKVKSRFEKATLTAPGDEILQTPASPPFMVAEDFIKQCKTPVIFNETPISAALDSADVSVGTIEEEIKRAWLPYKARLSPADREKFGKRIARELQVIKQCGFEEYFLNIFRIQNIAKETNNPLMLRGSATASMIMHVKGLSEVEPMEEGLLFERFLNEDRIEDPDVDLEFARPEEIRQVISEKFPGQVAYLSSDTGVGKPMDLLVMAKQAMNNFYPMNDKRRAAVKEAFDVLTAPLKDPKMSKWKLASDWQDYNDDFIAKKLPKNKQSETMIKLLDLANVYSQPGIQNGLSVGSMVFLPGGVRQYFPTLPAHKNGGVDGEPPRIPQNKYNILATGHIKYDLLTNRSFMRAMNAFTSLGLPHDMPINKNDKAVSYVFSRESLMGIHQVSGWVGAQLAEQAKPRNFAELTAMMALMRDGGDPKKDKNVRQYLEMRKNPEKVALPEALDPLLSETYGLLLYEEQLILMLTDIGGFSWNEADRFRSSLKKGKYGVIDEYKPEFLKNAMKSHGITESEAMKWYEPLESKRGSFVFNKAHATAYANLAVKQCWLKTHHPAQCAAELLCDDNSKTKFKGKPATLSMILDDWKKLHPKPRNDNNTGNAFILAAAKVLFREEGDINSGYRRQPGQIQNDINESINKGDFDFLLKPGQSRENMIEFGNKVFARFKERGYSPVRSGKGSSSQQAKAIVKKDKNILSASSVMDKKEGDVAPANKRSDKIDWRNGVTIPYLLDFFEAEGVISDLEISPGKAARYKFNVTDKGGNSHPFHVVSHFTGESSDAGSKYPPSSGYFQGGTRDKVGTSAIDLSITLCALTGYGDIKLPFKEDNRVPGAFTLENKKPFYSAFSKAVRGAESPLHDVASGDVVFGYSPRNPNAPISTNLRDNDRKYAEGKLKMLFADFRRIDLDGMKEQFDYGSFSIASMWSEKLSMHGKTKGKRYQTTEILANYQNISSEVPLFEQPLLTEETNFSSGGHQKFHKRDKEKFGVMVTTTGKIDVGSTTAKMTKIACGKVTPGADTLWLTEAAIDMLSFNELQTHLAELNNRSQTPVPFAEKNSVSIKSAGGATGLLTGMLDININIKKSGSDGYPTEIDLCKTESTFESVPLTEKQLETGKQWFLDNTFHVIKDGTPEGGEANSQFVAVLRRFGLTDEEIASRVVAHDFKPNDRRDYKVAQALRSMSKENEHLIYDGNIELWKRSSGLQVSQGIEGGYSVDAEMLVTRRKGKNFSEMTADEKQAFKVEMAQQFQYISGAKSIGIALDGDGAGLKDALTVKLACNMLDIPVGELMPEVKKEVKITVAGKERKYELKDHNDFLTLFKDLRGDGQQDMADRLLLNYGSSLKLPGIGKPGEPNPNQQLSNKRKAS